MKAEQISFTIDKPKATPATRLEAASALLGLHDFIGLAQRRVMVDGTKGEEKQFFIDKIIELAALVKGMPQTYEQNGKGDQAIVYLHYFTAGADFYILEKDACQEQAQAFGISDIYGDGGELGYISIIELLENGAELDFHFAPRPVSALKGANL